MARGHEAAMRSRGRAATGQALRREEQAQPQPFGFPRQGGPVEGKRLRSGKEFVGHGHQLTRGLVLAGVMQREVT